MTIRLRIPIISGCLQDKAEQTGCATLLNLCRQDFGGPDVAIDHLEWNGDFNKYVREIERDNAPECIIACIAYSYGCGRGVHELCEHLASYGSVIDQLHAIDPVPRVSKWALLANAWAFARWGSWRCPANVMRVYPYRCVNKPKLFDPVGRPVKVNPHTTTLMPEEVFGSRENLDKHAPGTAPQNRYADVMHEHSTRHSTIDDNPIVHRLIIARISKLLTDRSLAGVKSTNGVPTNA